MQKKLVVTWGLILVTFILALYINNTLSEKASISEQTKTSISEQTNEAYVSLEEVLTGESNHWKTTYTIEGYFEYLDVDGVLTLRSDGKEKYVIEYLGEVTDLEDMRFFKLEAQTNSYETSSNTSFYDGPLVYAGNASTSQIISVHNKDALYVTLTWYGDKGGTETIRLK